MLLLASVDFFQKKHFLQKNLSVTLSVSNGLDPDQDRRSVGPVLGPDCLQRLLDVASSKTRINEALRIDSEISNASSHSYFCPFK